MSERPDPADVIAEALRASRPHRGQPDHAAKTSARVLAALDAAGFVVVPKEPDDAMVDRARLAHQRSRGFFATGAPLSASPMGDALRAALNPNGDTQ